MKLPSNINNYQIEIVFMF